MKTLAKVLTIMALLAFAKPVQAQDVHERSDRTRLSYGFRETGLDTAIMRNSYSIRKLQSFFDGVRQTTLPPAIWSRASVDCPTH